MCHSSKSSICCASLYLQRDIPVNVTFKFTLSKQKQINWNNEPAHDEEINLHKLPQLIEKSGTPLKSKDHILNSKRLQTF